MKCKLLHFSIHYFYMNIMSRFMEMKTVVTDVIKSIELHTKKNTAWRLFVSCVNV